jgi:hypothetical protein
MNDHERPHRVPPDLQALVERYGGYDRITPRRWRIWDEANEEYQRAIRRDLPWPPEDGGDL